VASSLPDHDETQSFQGADGLSAGNDR